MKNLLKKLINWSPKLRGYLANLLMDCGVNDHSYFTVKALCFDFEDKGTIKYYWDNIAQVFTHQIKRCFIDNGIAFNEAGDNGIALRIRTRHLYAGEHSGIYHYAVTCYANRTINDQFNFEFTMSFPCKEGRPTYKVEWFQEIGRELIRRLKIQIVDRGLGFDPPIIEEAAPEEASEPTSYGLEPPMGKYLLDEDDQSR